MERHKATEEDLAILCIAHEKSCAHLADFITLYLNTCRDCGMTRPVASAACVHALVTALFKVSVCGTGCPLELLRIHDDAFSDAVAGATVDVAKRVADFLVHLRSLLSTSN